VGKQELIKAACKSLKLKYPPEAAKVYPGYVIVISREYQKFSVPTSGLLLADEALFATADRDALLATGLKMMHIGALTEGGYTTLAALRAATDIDLLALPHIGRAALKRIRVAAGD